MNIIEYDGQTQINIALALQKTLSKNKTPSTQQPLLHPPPPHTPQAIAFNISILYKGALDEFFVFKLFLGALGARGKNCRLTKYIPESGIMNASQKMKGYTLGTFGKWIETSFDVDGDTHKDKLVIAMMGKHDRLAVRRRIAASLNGHGLSQWDDRKVNAGDDSEPEHLFL